jgi:acetyl esterase/lipase
MTATPIERLQRILREKATDPRAPIPIAERRELLEAMSFKVNDDIDVETVQVAGIKAEWLRAPGVQTDRAILYLHGGGYVIGSLNTHRALGGEISRASQAAVLMLDYRLAPEFPFPAAVEDGITGYRWLLEQGFAPAQIAIAGDSAGGGLVVATLVAAREQGLAMPRSAVCISPWGDMTCSNELYRTRDDADPMVKHAGITQMAALYLNGADPKSPLASPNFADLTGLPPILIHVGSDETLLDDAIALDHKAKADGVQSTLEVWDQMIHVWHAFHPMLPEGKAGIERVGEFIRQQWAA